MKKKVLLKGCLYMLVSLFSLFTYAQTTTIVEWNFNSPYEYSGEPERIATPGENGTLVAVGEEKSEERFYITYSDLPTTSDGILTAKGNKFYNSVQLSDCNGVSTVRLYAIGQNNISDYSKGDNHDNYFQFSFSTLGYENIQAEFSFAGNIPSPSYMQLVYSPDGGTTWIDAGKYVRHKDWWEFTPYSESLTNAKNKENVLVRLIGGNDGEEKDGAVNLDYFRITGSEVSDDTYQERIVYSTDFQNWDNINVSPSPITVKKQTSQGEDLNFTLLACLVSPTGLESKFTNTDVVTPGYIRTQKKKDDYANIEPYIELSPLPSVTSISFVQAATGGTRGLTLKVKGDGDEDWVYLHNKSISQAAGEKLTYNVDRKNVQIHFGSFIPEDNNAYLLSLEIKGMVEITEPQANLSTSVTPAGAGSIKQSPNGIEFDQGTEITLTAERNFGYKFIKWVDSEGNELSTANPYIFTLDNNMEVQAVFEEMNVYSLAVDVTDKANYYLVSVNPVYEVNEGVYYFEEGTEVEVAASDNKILTFTNWNSDSNDTESIKRITMNEDISLTANYTHRDFIVAWDLHEDSPKTNRVADYYYLSDNQGMLALHKLNGDEAGWLAKGMSAGDYEGRYAAVNWQPFTNNDNYFYEISFSTKEFENVTVEAAMLYNYNVFSVQKVQYSIDGTTYKELGTYTLVTAKTWYDQKFNLPEEAWGAERVYVRFIPDYTSNVVGSSSGNDGTAITDIFVIGDYNEEDDEKAPELLLSSIQNGDTDISASGRINLSFHKKIVAGTELITLNGEAVDATFSAKSVIINYSGLDYNSEYTLSIPQNAILDNFGRSYEGTEIKFTTLERVSPEARLYDLIIAQDGSGDYATVQEAIDAAPENRVSPYLIFIKNGTYTGHVEIPSNKPYIHLIGQDIDKVIIADNRLSGDASGQPKYDTKEGATVFVNAANFYAENISFENSWGIEKLDGPQALAIYTNNDRIILNNCKLRSFQDTYLTSTKNVSDRHYLKNCFIEGAVDFIYGAGDVYFDDCTLYINRKDGGYIVAPSHKEDTSWGYVFMNNRITAPAPASSTTVYFGRPWQGAPKAVFINTIAEASIYGVGWYEKMGAIPHTFADYNTMDADGNPLDLSKRNNYYWYEKDGVKIDGTARHTLTDEEAAEYTVKNVLSGNDSWQPVLITESVNAPAISAIDGVINWEPVPYAICYVVTRNGEVVDIIKETTYTDQGSANGSIYTIQAVNEYGGLSAHSGQYVLGSDGVGETNQTQLLIYGGINQVVVNGIESTATIEVYSLSGMLINKFTTDSDITFSVNKGNYIVKVVTLETAKSNVVIVR